MFVELYACYLLCKGGYVFDSGGLVICLFVCLSVYVRQHYSKRYEQIVTKFY